MADITDEQIKEITDALLKRRKIEAIKLYRGAAGVGLKEAKDFIDDLDARLRGTHPDAFAKVPEGKAGCSNVLVLGLLLGGVVFVAMEFFG